MGIARVAVVAAAVMGLAASMTACQHFIETDTAGKRPVFTWRADAPVTGLTVLADDDCEAVKGTSRADRVWWQISGSLKPPVTYGVLPRGASEVAPARAFPEDCGHWTVTITDAAFQGESSTFRF